MNKELNVYVGCGPDIKEGFLHVDIRKMDHIDYVSNSWSISKYILEVDHIYSQNLLQTLTNYEADRTLRDWFKSLKSKGTIRVVVPNMDFYCRQWLDAEWNEDSLKNKMSDAQHSFSEIWGTQEQCDPWSNDYNSSYLSVNKSGYNEKRLQLLLGRIGFVDIKIEIKNQSHLIANATKPKYSGERQVGTTLESIRTDHRKRYEFASKYITKQNSSIIDGACGVGYGSFILAKNKNVEIINALDVSNEALTHAKTYFNNNKITYKIANLEDDELPVKKVDYFISFETIEHLPTPEKFIEKVSNNLKKDGIFIGSTPNEEIMPFVQQNFLYHTRHFMVNDLENMLRKYGFKEIEFFQQKREDPANILNINDGQYIIFIAKK